jgi:hypothetical protein
MHERQTPALPPKTLMTVTAMARVKMFAEDTRADALPEMCMKCGRPAVEHIRKQFSWYPPWVGLTLLIAWPVTLVLILVLTKK